MKCSIVKKTKNKICSADLNKRIKIQISQKTANNSPNQPSSVSFTTIATLWALIKTRTSNNFVNGVNIETARSTDFYIRYTNTINFAQQLFIEFENNLYLITSINNIDRDNKIIILSCEEKGDKNINANKR